MNTYAVQKTARSWDSFKNPLLTVLNAFNPTSVLEYGPGESTKIFQKHSSISLIDCIEHSPQWAEKTNSFIDHKSKLFIEPKHYKYPYVMGRLSKYDMVFIDGIERPACISLAAFRCANSGIVVLHDAERLDYKAAMELWGFKYFVDEGHTVFMTNSNETGNDLSELML